MVSMESSNHRASNAAKIAKIGAISGEKSTKIEDEVREKMSTNKS